MRFSFDLRRRIPSATSLTALAFGLVACAGSPQERPSLTDDANAQEPGRLERVPQPGYPNRPYDIFIPDGLELPAPAVLVLHGGGSDAFNAIRVTCPDGKVDNQDCITGHAARNGYIVIAPRGTSRQFLKRMRTWNAGGGDAGKQWICTSGLACEKGVDDVAYFNTLLDNLEASKQVDMQRVYATGISNGAAMAHRLACEIPDRIAAIAAIAGANQVSAVQGCRPGRAVPVLQIHGTADCAWPYDGGSPYCRGARGFDGAYLAVDRSMQVWREINGCSADVADTELTDNVPGVIRVTKRNWLNCEAPLTSYRIEGGGHTWPNGYQYFSVSRIGPVTRDLTNDHIWAFLSAQKLP
ncbi:MAG: PHB depolymerase family esterase [Woeseiaceae bacterium]